MNGLAASRPSATVSSSGATAPVASASASSLSVCGVDSASTIMIATSPSSSIRPATTMSKVASSSCGWVGNATHWSLISATRTPPIGPANGRPASCVDLDAALIDNVVQVLGVQREDRLDDLDLVAQALDEGRAQRAVDQPAGEDRVLGRAALAAEERTGDPPDRVHALLDVHRQREEVESVPRMLGRGGRRQNGGLVVQDNEGRAGCLAGKPASFKPD